MNIAIIGCGRVARHHCKAIECLDKINLVAVCDLDKDKSMIMGNEFKVQYFNNYKLLMKNLDDQIDIVVIITPSGMHYSHSMDIMEKFNKHIIVEKPTFLKLTHLQNAYAFSKKKNLQIFPVFQNRYNLAVKRVKKAIENNELGKIHIISVRVRWCRPQRYYDMSPWRGTFSHDGGALANQGIHFIDLMKYLGGEIADTFCYMKTLGSKIEVEDTAIAILNYENGAVGNLEITTAARPDDFEASISFSGSKGYAQIGGVAVNELQIFTPKPDDCKIYSDDYRDLDEAGKVYGRGHYEIYKQIQDHFYKNVKFPIDYHDCSNTIKLLHSFYCSNEMQKKIYLKDNFESIFLGREDLNISKLYT